jgi:hypothetical protein
MVISPIQEGNYPKLFEIRDLDVSYLLGTKKYKGGLIIGDQLMQ